MDKQKTTETERVETTETATRPQTSQTPIERAFADPDVVEKTEKTEVREETQTVEDK